MAYGQTLVSTLLPRRRVRRLPAKDWRPFLNLQRTEKAKNPLAFASGLTGAADEARTRYLHLGKVALYQMSYSRICDFEKKGGAADEARTRYLHLGKVALYQMSYSRIFLSSCFWLTASKQDLLYQVMCPLSTLFFFFSQIFPKYRKPTAHTVGFLFLFSFSASQCTQTSSCSPRRGRLSRCLIASCAGMPPYSTAYIASVIGMDTPCCCAR